MNRLKEVKAFVTEDIQLYHNLVMKHLPGADPELVLLSRNYQELEVRLWREWGWGWGAPEQWLSADPALSPS